MSKILHFDLDLGFVFDRICFLCLEKTQQVRISSEAGCTQRGVTIPVGAEHGMDLNSTIARVAT